MHTTEQLSTALAGRYAIERKIGEGGMATVYLARDVKHDRRVALKVLKPELGAVLGVERFLSEIKVTANLQHPNLLPLFDSGEALGLLFYVMPYVEGESLRARLDREQQLPVDEAVRIASAIASALAYAHERGVIHRDLKPENILLQSGQPVVADFGIALAVSNAGGARVTQTGLSLGTPQYMSPEQATGDRAIDARSDIYSLAAMTYEMIAGEPPHTGPNAQAIMAKLLTAEPVPLSTVRKSAPVHVELAVAKGLAKVPADRFANATEFANALTGQAPIAALTGATRTTAASIGTRGAGLGKRELAAWGTAAVALVAFGALAWLRARPAPEPPVRRLTVAVPDSVMLVGADQGSMPSVGISRNGDLIAFVGSVNQRRSLYLRRADDLGPPRELAGANDASRPGFSPDGRQVYFIDRNHTLQRMAVSGGTPQRMADSVQSYAVAEDGTIYFAGARRSLWALDGASGTPRLIAKPDSAAGTFQFFSVDVFPGASFGVATVARAPGLSTELATVDLRSGRVRLHGIAALRARCVPPGLVVITGTGSNSELLVVRMSASGDVVGQPDEAVATGIAGLTNGGGDFDVAGDGTMVYRWSTTPTLPPTTVAVDQGGRRNVIRSDGKHYDEPVVSRDGRRVVLRVGASVFNDGDLWLLELGSGAFTPLTRGNNTFRPAWSRDGRRLFYIGGRGVNGSEVHSKAWDGSGTDSVHLKAPGIAEFAEGLPGGWSILRNYGLRDILLVPTDSLATSSPRPFVVGPADETNPRISPSGRLVAYQSNESGAHEVYLRALPGPGPRVPVSVAGGTAPRWSPDGSKVYYRAKGALMFATIVEQPDLAVSRREVAIPKFLSDDRGQLSEWDYDIMPNGAILTTTPTATTPQEPWRLAVLLNWQQLLKQRSTAAAERP